MINILRSIRMFFLRLFGLHNLITILERVNWLQTYHCYFTDITKSAPVRGIALLQQQAGVKLLEIIDLICKKYNLKYWLGSGNLLGFVRHNGNPVPWDDDIDIYMLRPDYEKAIILFQDLFKGTNFTFFFTGWYFKFLKYKNAAIGFDIFPIDQYFKNIESEKDIKHLFSKIRRIKAFSKKKYLKASGYTGNNYLMEIWSGKLNKNSKKLFELRNTVKANWDRIVMEGNKPAPNGNLIIGYERVKWQGNQISWNYNWVFPLKRMKYYNVETNIPNDPDLYLYSQFGDFWTFPKKFIIHSQSRIKLPLEAIFSLQELSNLKASEFLDSLKSIYNE